MKMATAAMRFIKKEQQGYFKGYGITLLHLAAICGQYDVLKKLFDSGANKLLHDKYDYRGRTALSFAVFYNHPDACQLILEYERLVNPLVFKAQVSVGAGVGRAPPEFGGSETRGRKRKRQSATIGTPGIEKLTTALVLSEGCTLLESPCFIGPQKMVMTTFLGTFLTVKVIKTLTIILETPPFISLLKKATLQSAS